MCFIFSETFTALLSPGKGDGSGAVAMITFNRALSEINFIVRAEGFLRGSGNA